MSRYKKHTVEKAGDWSVETPDMDNYKMACCDCGLVHDIKFRAIEVLEGDPKGGQNRENNGREFHSMCL